MPKVKVVGLRSRFGGGDNCCLRGSTGSSAARASFRFPPFRLRIGAGHASLA